MVTTFHRDECNTLETKKTIILRSEELFRAPFSHIALESVYGCVEWERGYLKEQARNERTERNVYWKYINMSTRQISSFN